jgi:hypothetical protein
LRLRRSDAAARGDHRHEARRGAPHDRVGVATGQQSRPRSKSTCDATYTRHACAARTIERCDWMRRDETARMRFLLPGGRLGSRSTRKSSAVSSWGGPRRLHLPDTDGTPLAAPLRGVEGKPPALIASTGHAFERSRGGCRVPVVLCEAARPGSLARGSAGDQGTKQRRLEQRWSRPCRPNGRGEGSICVAGVD